MTTKQDGFALHWIVADLGDGYYTLSNSSTTEVSDVQYNIGGIPLNITTDEESYASADYSESADEVLEFFAGGQPLTAFRIGNQYKLATIASSETPDESVVFFIKGRPSRAYRMGGRWYMVTGEDTDTPALDLGILGNQMAATQPDNLMGLYMMDEDSATAENNPGLLDSSGNNNTATTQRAGNANWDDYYDFQQGPQNNILQYIDIVQAQSAWNSVTTINPQNEAYTLMAFVNNELNAKCAISFATEGNNLNRGALLVQMYDSGALLCRSFDDTPSNPIITTIANATGLSLNAAWSQIVLTFDGDSTVRLYYNGVDALPSTTGVPQGTFANVNRVSYGSNANGLGATNSITGPLGPSAFWNVALTADEVADIYTASGL